MVGVLCYTHIHIHIHQTISTHTYIYLYNQPFTHTYIHEFIYNPPPPPTHRVEHHPVRARHAHAEVGLGEEGLHMRRHVHAHLLSLFLVYLVVCIWCVGRLVWEVGVGGWWSLFRHCLFTVKGGRGCGCVGGDMCATTSTPTCLFLVDFIVLFWCVGRSVLVGFVGDRPHGL